MESPTSLQLVLLAMVACITLVYMLAQTRKKSYFDTLPAPPKKLFLRNLDVLWGDRLFDNIVAVARKYGPLYSLDVVIRKFVCPTDAVLAAKCLQVGYADKDPNVYWGLAQNTVPSCPSIVTTHGGDPYWKVVRVAAAQAFSMKNLRKFFPDVVRASNTALDVVSSSGDVVDLNDMALRITMDVLGSFLFGKGLGGADRSDSRALDLVAAQLRMNHYLMVNPWFVLYFFWKKDVRNAYRCTRNFDSWLRELVEEMRSNPPPQHTLGASLLACKDPLTGEPVSDLRLRAELSSFVLAGWETSGNSATIALFYIITHAEVEARVAEELQSLGLLASPENPSPRQIQWEDLSKLRVLNAAILESMRVMPSVATGSIRVLTKDVEASGQKIPQGTNVWVQTIALHRNPLLWENPDEYNIDRWLTEEGLNTEDDDMAASRDKAPKGFMPFSEGPRNCVGQALARLEILVILAQLLAKFKVELAPEMGGPQGFIDSLVSHISVRTTKGLLCTLKPRASAA